MPKFLVQGSLSKEGITGVMADGGSRRHLVVKQAVESMDGTLEAFYFAFGHTDVVALVDLPTNTAAAALAMAISSTGAVSSLTTTPLLTAEEVDGAVKMSPDYTPPGDTKPSGR